MDNSNDIQRILTTYIESSEALARAIQNTSQNEKLSEEEMKRVAYALNMCTVSVSQIVDYADLNVVEQEYDAILNNLNLELIPKDEPLLHILKVLLDTITFYRIEEGDKMMVEKEYQQRIKNAIWSAVPNFGLLVAGGDPITMAVSIASQVGIGYMNYRKEKAELGIEYENKMWELQRSAIEEFNGIRRELFDTAWRLADKYQFPDEYRLTEKQIKQYNSILQDSDKLRKFERLESIQEKFEAYPPFWYFIGNAAHFISGDTSLSDKTRDEYRKKALDYFDKYDSLSKFSILREDLLAASCALEHADLLNPEQDREQIESLIKRAVNKCGNANDVLELCAISYLRIGKQEEAAKILKILVNEDYNRIVNAQLLSSIYVHQLDRSGYELLAKRVGIDYLFPMPKADTQDVKQLEAEFGSMQRAVLKQKIQSVFDLYLRSNSVKWNKLTSIFDVNATYEESFFYDTQEAKADRMAQAKKVFLSESKKDQYQRFLESNGYELGILEILNSFTKGLFSMGCISDLSLKDECNQSIRSSISGNRDDINLIQNAINQHEFDLNAFRLSQEITLETIVGPVIKRLLIFLYSLIDRSNANSLSYIESDLRSFCISQGIPEPEIAISKASNGVDTAFRSSNESFEPELFGQNAIAAKRNAEFLSEMASYVRNKFEHIAVSENDAAIYLRDDSEFEGYFYNTAFTRHPDLRSHAVLVIKDKTKKKNDLVFTTHGLVEVTKEKVGKFITPYQEVKLHKEALILFRGEEYRTSALDINSLFSLIRELGSKFIRSVDEKVERISGTVTVTELNKWFRSRPDAMRDDVVRAYAVPTSSVLEHSGYHFEDEVDPKCNLLQYYYEQKTGDVLGMRIISFDAIESNFQSKLAENHGIINVGR